VVAKVERLQGELYPRVGCILTNLSRPPENIVAFYNRHDTCKQWIKEGKGADPLHEGCHAGCSQPTLSGFSCTLLPTISATSRTPWQHPRQ
jgi:hypothetical protein